MENFEQLVNKNLFSLVMTHAVCASREDDEDVDKHSAQTGRVPDISNNDFFAEGTHCQREASYFITKP